jgi:hypothetical protein
MTFSKLSKVMIIGEPFHTSSTLTREIVNVFEGLYKMYQGEKMCLALMYV